VTNRQRLYQLASWHLHRHPGATRAYVLIKPIPKSTAEPFA